jgi:acetyl esterase/lipase
MKNLLFIFLFMNTLAFSQKVDSLALYPAEVPGLISSKKPEKTWRNTDNILCVRDIQAPKIYVYTPKKKTTDACVLIYPGGGYYILAIEHEGHEIAKWYNERGMTAIVVKYRTPQDEFMTNKEIRPLQDAQQAIRMVRKNALKFGINPNKLGIMGFSAGGHLASTAGTHFKKPVGEATDDGISLRPDFMILMYPVISFSDKFGHIGSRTSLLGENPSSEKIDEYSNEKNVDADTPPTFLVSTSDDWVNVQNSVEFLMACKKHKVPAEMHVYESGGHGYALKKNKKGPVETWDARLEDWLKFRKYL